MTDAYPLRSHSLPVLPLLLWGTPPGLELMLEQEGVPYQKVGDAHPLAFQGGQFVLYDSRSRGRGAGGPPRGITTAHHTIDVDLCRRAEPVDPFQAVLDDRAGPASWFVAGARLTERVSRFDRAAIRRRALSCLRHEIQAAGGLWARLGPYPSPYRSAFNLRVDLDEPYPDDYFRFARARHAIDDCTTHFVATAAYGDDHEVLADLRGLDTQSHGHFHHVYRDPTANRRNLERAHERLQAAGIEPVGFAAPEGRWNRGLEEAVEAMGYRYASDFHLGFDDVPFQPRRGRRGEQTSPILQIPVHPVCEGLFLEAGLHDPPTIAAYLRRAVRARIESGEPAFVYGHPERRLGRFPEVVTAIAREVAGEPLVWRTTLTLFARWWRWRAMRRWAVLVRGPGRYEVQFEDGDTSFRPSLEIVRGDHVASFEVAAPRLPIAIEDLLFVRRRTRFDRPAPLPSPRAWTIREAVREALDWETVTPFNELPTSSLRARLKRHLRGLKSRRPAR